MSVRVVKVGGALAEDAGWMRGVAAAVAAAPAGTVLVHGGGGEVTALQRALGAEPEWRDGLRVTSPATLEILRMVLSGAVNKRWAGALQDAGVDALGLSGEDAGLLRARPSHGGALGRTGELVAVRAPLIALLLDNGIVPVVSPVSRGPDGGGLNVNADDAAADVAAALGAGELLFVSDVDAVRDGPLPVDEMDAERAEGLLASGAASGGMRPKLRAALRAHAAGVARVRIGGVGMLTDASAGTLIGKAVHAGC